MTVFGHAPPPCRRAVGVLVDQLEVSVFLSHLWCDATTYAGRYRPRGAVTRQPLMLSASAIVYQHEMRNLAWQIYRY